jgi:hypothetical protein
MSNQQNQTLRSHHVTTASQSKAGLQAHPEIVTATRFPNSSIPLGDRERGEGSVPESVQIVKEAFRLRSTY